MSLVGKFHGIPALKAIASARMYKVKLPSEYNSLDLDKKIVIVVNIKRHFRALVSTRALENEILRNITIAINILPRNFMCFRLYTHSPKGSCFNLKTRTFTSGIVQRVTNRNNKLQVTNW